MSDLLSLKVENVRDSKGRIKDRIVLREAKTGKAKNFPIGDSACD